MSNASDFVIINGMLEKYVGPGGDVVVPAGVTSVGDEAFQGCNSLKSVALPRRLTSVGDAAFSGCYSLTSVSLPQSLTSIGSHAFYGCRSLTSVELPESLTSIGDAAFKNCWLLKSVALPQGLTSIGREAFSYCDGLTSLTLPDGLTGIGDAAFSYCKSLKSLTLPDGLTSIGHHAFDSCYSLTSVELPEGVTSVGDGVFQNCRLLKSVALPKGLTSIGDEAFQGCKSLTGVALPDGMTSIGSAAFRGCESLTSIALPKGLTSIGDEAFQGCNSLKSLALPHGPTSIGNAAFSGCYSLTSVALPQSLTSIGSHAFFGCKSLTSLELPESLTSLGDLAFYGCESLTSVSLPQSLTSLGRSAFEACESLSGVALPQSLTSIGDEAFKDCKSLTSVTIPDGVTSIGDDAFSGCQRIEIRISDIAANRPENFSIKKGVLKKYLGLGGDVVVPDGVTSIGAWAFQNCRLLKSVALPQSLTRIGDWAFCDCSSLAVLVFPAELNRKLLPDTSLALIVAGEPDRYFAYSVKLFRDNLTDFAKRGAWARYDLELVNNGPAYKYKLPARLLGALGRLLDPVELTEKNRALLAELLCKNAKKLVPLAEELRRPRLVSDLLSLGILDEKTVKAVKKLLAASAVPEIAALAAQDVPAAAEKKAAPKKAAAPRSPLQAEYAEKLEAIGGEGILRKMKLAGLSMPAVLLTDGGKAPEELFRFLLASYGGQPDGQYRFVPEADEAAALLRYDSLCAAMDAVSGNLDGPSFPSVLPLLCRFGSAKQIRAMTAAYKDWGDWDKYNRRGRTAQDVLARALNLSDTREAIVWLEKHGGLSAYAALRGVTKPEIYDRFLFDFGFDESGKRVFDLGATTVEVSLTRELGLALYDTARKKTVRSIPTKGVDPAVQKKAADELADMRQNLRKARKIKQDQLFKDYLDGKTLPAKRWKQSYLTNPFLRRIAQLLVWTQRKATFILSDGGALDSAGRPYELTDAPIRLAHPMEMGPKDVTAWQKYFTSHGLKQPFLQVWEPVYRREEIREGRYRGCRIDPLYLKTQQKRGIVANWYESDYSISKYVHILGFSVEERDAPYQDGDERDYLELVSIRPEVWNRRSNMIVGFLDRLTVWERVKKDDVSVMDMMSGFTLAQIAEFIALSQEANATNVLAALLEYKNKTFPDFDPMDEFTLEW